VNTVFGRSFICPAWDQPRAAHLIFKVRLRPIEAAVLHHESPICGSSPGKLTATACSTHRSPLDQQFAIDRLIGYI
jgi:hypothetical protein